METLHKDFFFSRSEVYLFSDIVPERNLVDGVIGYSSRYLRKDFNQYQWLNFYSKNILVILCFKNVFQKKDYSLSRSGPFLTLILPPDSDRLGMGVQTFCLCNRLHNIPDGLKTVPVNYLNGCRLAEMVHIES